MSAKLAKSGAEQPEREQRTVLVVEDNELNMKLFQDVLEFSGYKFVGSKDGMDALELARRHSPDLIILDIQLPKLSGLDVAKWIKEDDRLSPIPIIAVTAFAMKGDREKILGAGCDAYIQKPIVVSDFVRTVRQYLD